MSVRVSFTIEPDEPDDDDPTGMSNDEYERVTDALMEQFGAEDIKVERVAS